MKILVHATHPSALIKQKLTGIWWDRMFWWITDSQNCPTLCSLWLNHWGIYDLIHIFKPIWWFCSCRWSAIPVFEKLNHLLSLQTPSPILLTFHPFQISVIVDCHGYEILRLLWGVWLLNGFNLVGHWYACQVKNTFFSCLLFTIDGVLESSEATPNGASESSFRSNLRGEVEVSERRPYHLTSIRQNAIRFFTKQKQIE